MNDWSRSEPAPRGLSNAEIAAIHKRYGPLLLLRCRLLMGNHAAADDALQDCFLRIMRHGGAFRTAASELGWLYRVVRNCCFDARKRGSESVGPTNEIDSAATYDPLPVVAMIAIERALARLPGRDRQLAILAAIDGTSQRDMATQMGWSRQTVNRRLGQVRHRLVRLLDLCEPSQRPARRAPGPEGRRHDPPCLHPCS